MKYRPSEPIERVQAGDLIRLEAEPTNQYDEFAIKVLDRDNNLLGYVPKKATWLLHLLRKANVKLDLMIFPNPHARDEEKLLVHVHFMGDNNNLF